MNHAPEFRNETVNDRLKRTLERNRPKPVTATKKAVDLGGGEASDLASATFDLPQVMRAQRLANRELAHQAREKTRQTVKSYERDLADDMDDEEEVEPVIRKPQKKAPAKINYIKKEKQKARPSFSFGEETKVSRGLVYFGWAFCLFLVLRLTFAGGGIIDNIKKASVLSDKKDELTFTEQENIALGKEIGLIEKNAAYQKKLVRDNLGFIASDEYLVLFQEEKKAKSI